MKYIRDELNVVDENDHVIFVKKVDRTVGILKDDCINRDYKDPVKMRMGARDSNDCHYSRSAWKKFLICCVGVLEDIQQIHHFHQAPGAGASPFQGPDATQYLDFSNVNLPIWRLDVHTSKRKMVSIPITQVTHNIDPKDMAMLWQESWEQGAFSTKVPLQLLPPVAANMHRGTGQCHAYLAQNLPQGANILNNNHWARNNLPDVLEFRRANGTGPATQPTIPSSRDKLITIRELMNSWGDPHCPGRVTNNSMAAAGYNGAGGRKWLKPKFNLLPVKVASG